MTAEFDLWGDPIPPKVEKRGRPVHVVTPAKSLRVATLVALRWTNERISAAMGITEPTLRKYYFSELKAGLDQKRAEVMVRLYEQVQAGNVSAIKEFNRQVELADMRNGAPLPVARRERTIRLGKKEQAVIDASAPNTGSPLGSLLAQRHGDGSLH